MPSYQMDLTGTKHKIKNCEREKEFIFKAFKVYHMKEKRLSEFKESKKCPQ
jgi:hypothetical protein